VVGVVRSNSNPNVPIAPMKAPPHVAYHDKRGKPVYLPAAAAALALLFPQEDRRPNNSINTYTKVLLLLLLLRFPLRYRGYDFWGLIF
jgi:hypothetical protein